MSAKSRKNTYGRLYRTTRRDDARPGDVITAMEQVLFRREATIPAPVAVPAI